MAQLTDDCFAFGGRLIPLAETTQLLSEQFATVAGTTVVSLAEAAGRVLAGDLLAPRCLPPHANSMDTRCISMTSARQRTRSCRSKVVRRPGIRWRRR